MSEHENVIKNYNANYVAKRDNANGYPVSRDDKAHYNDWACFRGIDISLRRIADVMEDWFDATKGEWR